jgi:hypothetical protein
VRGIIRRGARYLRRTAELPAQLARTLATGPTRVAGAQPPRNLVRIERDGKQHLVARVPQAAIATNRNDYVTIYADRATIAEVSWRHTTDAPHLVSFGNLVRGKTPLLLRPIAVAGTVVSLLTGGGGNYNYYHWLFDALPRLHLIQHSGLLHEEATYLVPAVDYPFQRWTLEALGIPPERILASTQHPHVQAEVVIATSHPNPPSADAAPWIVDYLRASLLRFAEPARFPARIYLTRRAAQNRRRISNEADLWPRLEAEGFEMVDTATLSVPEQMALFAQSERIVAIHGAGLANLAFASAGARVVELASESFHPRMYQRIAASAGVEHHLIRAPAAASRRGAAMQDLTLTPANLEQILTLVA